MQDESSLSPMIPDNSVIDQSRNYASIEEADQDNVEVEVVQKAKTRKLKKKKNKKGVQDPVALINPENNLSSEEEDKEHSDQD